MEKITKVYYVDDDRLYKKLMTELEEKGYVWYTDFAGENKPTTDKFNPGWTWDYSILVHLYDNKTISYEPTEEGEQDIPEEYKDIFGVYK